MSGFSIVSYNVLADAYIRPAWYAHCDPAHLDPAWRRGALVRHVAALDADIVCLQEVEAATYGALQGPLGGLGYEGHHAPKGRGKPDGCATFFRADRLDEVAVRVLRYADGRDDAPDSGHVVLLLELTQHGRALVVANTHLKWDEPGRSADAHVGWRQAHELIAATDGAGDALVVCGDLNVEPHHEIIDELLRTGLADAYAARPDDVTCNANRRPRRIDFVLAGAAFDAEPVAIPEITADTPLPSADQPSDHLPIGARLTWRS